MSHLNPEEIAKKREEYFNDPGDKNQLPLIVKEINARVLNGKREIYEIGRLLTKAKSLVGHGNFKQWVKDNFEEISYQTARNFMNVYRYCLGRPELVESIKASVLYMIATDKFPQDLREYLFENADDLDQISNKRLKKLYEKFKRGEMDLKSPEIKALRKFNRKEPQYASYKAQLNLAISGLKKLKEVILKSSKDIIWPISPSGEKSELNPRLAKEVEDLMADIDATIQGIKPDFAIVDRLRPVFRLPEKTSQD
jgi:hypothetical protein